MSILPKSSGEFGKVQVVKDLKSRLGSLSIDSVDALEKSL